MFFLTNALASALAFPPGRLWPPQVESRVDQLFFKGPASSHLPLSSFHAWG